MLVGELAAGVREAEEAEEAENVETATAIIGATGLQFIYVLNPL